MSVKQVLSEALGGIQGANQARGLHNFIQEIRLCSNPTQEQVGPSSVPHPNRNSRPSRAYRNMAKGIKTSASNSS